MAYLVPRTLSVGSLTKKILAVNPHLGTTEIIQIVRECTTQQGGLNNEFGPSESIDEARALELAKAARPPSDL